MADDDASLAQFRQLVDAFYERVRSDEEIGPVFNDAISDWPHHLDKLADFWHSVMFGSGRYPGGLMMRHFMHRDRIKPEHFERWLALFKQTARDTCSAQGAAFFIDRAERIADSFQMALGIGVKAWRPPG